MKRLGVFLLPLDRMLVHPRSFPRNLLGFPNNLPVPIYTPGWREALWELSVLPKNTTQCPRPGLEPGPLAPGTNALTMRPWRLPQLKNDINYMHNLYNCSAVTIHFLRYDWIQILIWVPLYHTWCKMLLHIHSSLLSHTPLGSASSLLGHCLTSLTKHSS